jgi:hypothetical protein
LPRESKIWRATTLRILGELWRSSSLACSSNPGHSRSHCLAAVGIPCAVIQPVWP